MLAQAIRVVALPRLGARFVSTAVGRSTSTSSSVTAAKATITTTAASPANPSPAAMDNAQMVSNAGRLKSASRYVAFCDDDHLALPRAPSD